MKFLFDMSPHGYGRVIVFTIIGTTLCISVAFAIDSYSIADGWRWGAKPINNLTIPLVLAPPLLWFLLSQQRALALAHRDLLVVASTDGLTSCLTRGAFTTLVDAYLDKVAHAPSGGALLVIDVDHFKNINDALGHQRGDEALKAVTDSIKGALRDIDLVGRLGGEEFGVFLPGAGPDQARLVGERVRTFVNRIEFYAEGVAWPISVSVGGTVAHQRASFADLYRHADSGLYAAKRNGRNRVEMRIPPPDWRPRQGLNS
ncbi:GGDEF domain-containing protein [Mesorhizobium sp. ASY16-5R]|uniref:GGDEF domain-containing protein n=1 Tax=Mesorhizobium sp. ASY16-5R TaxID=3445772 RepID=UPI003FA04D72